MTGGGDYTTLLSSRKELVTGDSGRFIVEVDSFIVKSGRRCGFFQNDREEEYSTLRLSSSGELVTGDPGRFVDGAASHCQQVSCI